MNHIIASCPLCKGDTEMADTCLYRRDGDNKVSDWVCTQCEASFQEIYEPDSYENTFGSGKGTEPYTFIEEPSIITEEPIGDYDLYEYIECSCGIHSTVEYTFKESHISDIGNNTEYNVYKCEKHEEVLKVLKDEDDDYIKQCQYCYKDLKRSKNE